MSRPARRRRLAGLVCACLLLAPLGAAHASRESPGPALTIDVDAARAAIGFPQDARGKQPILLVHGTDSSTRESWATNYVPALTQAGYAVFTIDLPFRALVDIQESSEYVVYALRVIHELTGRRVTVVGHSQGGLEPRWALEWWPDLRPKVNEVITLATPHHGTYIANLYCASPCPPADWQMEVGSNFLSALNRGDETPGRIDYTSIFSLTDELVQPQIPASTSAIEGASNVLVQNVCPGRPVNHVGMLRDPVVYALVLDALQHRGPARPERVGLATCAQATIPGVDPIDALDPEIQYWSGFTRTSAVPPTDSEPPLRDYARS